MGGKVHAELPTRQAPIEDEVRVLVRLENGTEQVLALVEVFGDAPLLEADDVKTGHGGLGHLRLHDVDAATASAGNGMPGERTGDAPDIDVFDRAEEAQGVEDDRANAHVAEFEQRGILRAVGLVVDRVEDELALLDAAARQPLDLAEELGGDALDEILVVDLGLVRHARERGVHLGAPREVVRRLLTERRGQGHAPLHHHAANRRTECRIIEFGGLDCLEGRGDGDIEGGGEESDFGLAETVMPGESRDNLLDLDTEGFRRQRADALKASGREPARTGVAIVEIDRLVLDGDAGGLDRADDLLGALGGTRHTPVVAARTKGVANLGRTGVEEADLPLRDECLQDLVRLEREVHAARIGADQHIIVREQQVGGIRPLRHRLVLREFGLAGGDPLLVQLVRPGDALHGVDALAGHQAGRAEEERADAGLERPVGILRKNGISKNLHIIPSLRFRAYSRATS